jgi:hypothetical protein
MDNSSLWWFKQMKAFGNIASIAPALLQSAVSEKANQLREAIGGAANCLMKVDGAACIGQPLFECPPAGEKARLIWKIPVIYEPWQSTGAVRVEALDLPPSLRTIRTDSSLRHGSCRGVGGSKARSVSGSTLCKPETTRPRDPARPPCHASSTASWVPALDLTTGLRVMPGCWQNGSGLRLEPSP